MQQICSIRFLGSHNTKENAFRTHKHDCFELIWLQEGHGTAIVGDEEFAIRSQSCWIVAPNTPHTEQLYPFSKLFFIGFRCHSDQISIQPGIFHSVPSMLPMIFREYQHQKIGYETAANAMLTLIFVELARIRGYESSGCKDLQYIKRYIEQYYDQKINFRSLAADSGYSYDYFHHLFKQRFGLSPQAYMISIRLEQAVNLLQSTELSCAEIAAQCGFSNPSQMSAMIKKNFNRSPRDFKKTDLYKFPHNE